MTRRVMSAWWHLALQVSVKLGVTKVTAFPSPPLRYLCLIWWTLHCTLSWKKLIEIERNWISLSINSLKSFIPKFPQQSIQLYLIWWSILDAVCVGISVTGWAGMKAVDKIRWTTGTACLDQEQWISVRHDHIWSICCHHQVHQQNTLDQHLKNTKSIWWTNKVNWQIKLIDN